MTKIEDVSVSDLVSALRRGRRLIFVSGALFALTAIAYAMLATEWYRAEVVLVPSSENGLSSSVTQLGGLVALTGLKFGDGVQAESLAYLESRELANVFVEKLGLLPVFFSDDWDALRGRWLQSDASEWPDTRDAIEYFHGNVLQVRSDPKTGLIRLTIDWHDPEIAANWAMEFVDEANAQLRARALEQSTENVNYLKRELARADLVALQESIARLLETEVQRLMMARGNIEFAFRVLDPATVPKYRQRPKRMLVSLAGAGMGIFFGVILALIRHSRLHEMQT